MNEEMTKVELDKFRKLKEILDMAWPYTLSDMQLRNLTRIMRVRCQELITQRQHTLGYMAVYPIVDGCSREAIFEGPPEACRQFVEQHREFQPDAQVIVLTI